MGVLQISTCSRLFEHGIEVPKITLEDGIPQRAVLCEPLPVGHLADGPVPETVILARGRCALGVVWFHVSARGGGAAGGSASAGAVVLAHGRDGAGRTWFRVRGQRGASWWMLGARHVQWHPPEGLTASPARHTNIGCRAHPRDPGADRGAGGG